MDTLQSKLYGISTYEYYCPTCSTRSELGHLTFFKSQYECPDCCNNTYLNIVKDKDE